MIIKISKWQLEKIYDKYRNSNHRLDRDDFDCYGVFFERARKNKKQESRLSGSESVRGDVYRGECALSEGMAGAWATVRLGFDSDF